MSALLALKISNPFGSPSWFVAETTSTMEDARRLAQGGAAPGTVVMADRQSAGRGRIVGRRWVDEQGMSLLATLILEPQLAALPGFTLRIGLGLARACENFADELARGPAHQGQPFQVMLKWPNDLIAGGKKLGGVICEAETLGLFVGFGINVGQREFPPELSDEATSIALASDAPSSDIGEGPRTDDQSGRLRLLELCLEGIVRVVGEEGWREAVEARLWRRGEEIAVVQGRPGDGQPFQGRLLGIDAKGCLLIEKEGKRRVFDSAELELRSGSQGGRAESR
jgi:BirA family biotin operon repressor/biotin-[acetyl-CoA-carboxylase] ligase